MYSYDQGEISFKSEVFMQMKSPCEEIVWDVLPSIRAATAEELIKRGISQKEVSRMLGITPPAVSQYLSKKRGYNIEFREDIRQAIGLLADDLIQGNVKGADLVKRICSICRMLQDDETACNFTGCKGP
jgi:predicted transcriptional regulator